MDQFGYVLANIAQEGKKKMKKDKKDHCKKADCTYYDQKNFSNNCSASATQHKRKYTCHLYLKKKEEV